MSGDQLPSDDELEQILGWYAAVGVDLAVGESPVDQFAAQTAAALGRSAPGLPQHAAPAIATGATDAGEGGAVEAATLAAGAATLDDLKAVMERFEGSPLRLRATQLVFADGNPAAHIMLVGEAPGREEDLQGRPFVGRSGQLLDRMLATIGLDRSKVYIANTIPWRPPGNRTPTPAEIAVCLPFLHRQIELVRPRILVSLGAPAAQTLLGRPVSITKLRGQWQDVAIAGQSLRLLPTLHPAFLLRQPAQKQLAWRDLLTLKDALGNADAASD